MILCTADDYLVFKTMGIDISTTVEAATSDTDPDRVFILALPALEVVLQILQAWKVDARSIPPPTQLFKVGAFHLKKYLLSLLINVLIGLKVIV